MEASQKRFLKKLFETLDLITKNQQTMSRAIIGLDKRLFELEKDFQSRINEEKEKHEEQGGICGH